MRIPDVSEERTIVQLLVVILVVTIVARMTMATYEITGQLFDASLYLIYAVLILLIVLGLRYVWRSRDVLQQGP